MPWPLYAGKEPQSQSWSGHFGEEKKSCPYQNLNPDCLTHSLVAIPTTLLQFQYIHYKYSDTSANE